MAKHFIQKMHLKKGALTRQAKAAGEGVQEFADKHKGDKGTTGKRARLAIAFRHMKHK